MSSLPTARRQTILILDFGGQYTQLIARRVREQNVYCEIEPHTLPLDSIRQRNPAGIILSGGPSSVYDPGAPVLHEDLYMLGIPILGICYGLQLMAVQLGGEVVRAEHREYGRAQLRITEKDALFEGLARELTCWMSHGDRVESPPKGFRTTAVTSNAPVAAMSDPNRKLYGVQFHPEVSHTPFGSALIRQFLYLVCGCSGEWTPVHFVEETVEAIRERTGDARVVCGVSGGVDSCTTAALVYRAIGDRLTCVFVDHGLLRQGEAEEVRELFTSYFPAKLVAVDARDRFLDRLAGVTDPEEKRKAIGEEFVRVFEETADEVSDCRFLAQGTLYPDVIESGSAHAAKIKTHHNVGGLPSWMRLETIEPLRMLFKDEARSVALELGLPESIVHRQPFPGPGLAVRVEGEVTSEKLERLRQADAIVMRELRQDGWLGRIWQSFAVLPLTQSVGVMGDQRTHQSAIVVRAVTSEDAMTAEPAELPWTLLRRIADRIVNEVEGVNRVLYDLSSKPPATIEWE